MIRKRKPSEGNCWKRSIWEGAQRKIMEKRVFGLKTGWKTLKTKDRNSNETVRRNRDHLPKAENSYRSSWNRQFNLKIFV